MSWCLSGGIHVPIGRLLTHCDLDKYGTLSLALPESEGRYLLPQCRVDAQVGHNDLEHWKSNYPGSFALVNAAERILL